MSVASEVATALAKDLRLSWGSTTLDKGTARQIAELLESGAEHIAALEARLSALTAVATQACEALEANCKHCHADNGVTCCMTAGTSAAMKCRDATAHAALRAALERKP